MTSSFRVAFDATAIPETPMGAGRYVVELVRALRGNEQLALSLLTRKSDTARWKELAGPRHDVDGVAPNDRLLRLVYEELLLGRVAEKLQPRPSLYFGPHYNLPLALKMRSVVTVHDLTLIEHPQWHERSKVMVFRRALKNAARHASGIVFVSNATRDRYLSHFATDAKMFVIAHGLDHDQFTANAPSDEADDAVLSRLAVTAPYLLIVGTIEPRKNHHTLVQAFERLAKDDPDLTLVIAGGKGWGSDALYGAIAASAYANRIMLLGYVADGDLPALYRRAAVTCYPSLEEGFGIPALEAMSCGSPLVTTAGTTMAEFAHGIAQLINNPLDAEELAVAISAARQMSVSQQLQGIEVAAAYTWERSANEHVSAFLDVADR